MEELHGEFKIDHLFELYVKAWIVYHETANQIDGHIKKPRTTHEWVLVVRAMREATRAQARFMFLMGMIRPTKLDNPEAYDKWNAAKLEALRRLGL